MAREGPPPVKIPPVPPHDSKRRVPIVLPAFLALVAVVVGLWAIQIDRPAATPPSPVSLPPAFAGQSPPYSIVRVPGRDVVVINAGLGDRVRQAMTFDVYDKQIGIPGDQPAANRQGSKATVEIIRIGPGFSECRVIRRTPNLPLVQGDLVVPAPAIPAQPAHSGQSPPVPTPVPEEAGTNPGRS